MRLIDADLFMQRIESYNTSDKMDKALYNFALHEIASMPTVDVLDKIKTRIEREAELQRAASMTQEDINISPKTADVNRMSMAYFAALTAIFGAFALRKSYAYEKK